MGRAPFADRAAAGAELGAALAELDLDDPVLLGLARGGVVVAVEAARVLGVPVDVLVVRKLGHPRQVELGLGAVAEGGEPVWDDGGLAAMGLTREALAVVVDRERVELRRRVEAYRGACDPLAVAGRTVVVVDDGIATGVTARAAVASVRRRGATSVTLAAPVASKSALDLLAGEVDQVVTLLLPERFGAVSRFYRRFGQTTDAEVVALLTG